jgi:hypothetical protein
LERSDGGDVDWIGLAQDSVMPEKIHGKIKGKRKQGSEKYVNYG